MISNNAGHVRPRQEQKSAILDFSNFLHLSPGSCANSVRTSPQNVQKCARFAGIRSQERLNLGLNERGGTAKGGKTKMHSWTRVRRNGAFGARAQDFAIFDCRNKSF